MRLFIAINFNDGFKKSLSSVINELRGAARQGNFTRPENLHLTLVFIGETTKTEMIKRAMDGIKAERFVLNIKGLGKFNREGGDIYWLGVEQNPVLASVYEQLCDKLNMSGFTIKKQDYTPHLTLGRQVILPESFNWQVFARSIPALRYDADAISLMKSERLNGRLTYREIYQRKLGASINQ